MSQSRLTSRPVVYGIIFVLSPLIAGLYGAAHNQISYTVSPEYFTKFKFIQFGLEDSALPERLRASTIGFLAAWWMGPPIGLILAWAGLWQRDGQQMLRYTLWAFLVAIVFTLLFGLSGLLYGYMQTSRIRLEDYRDLWYIPKNIVHLRRYLCAGYMHNSSYLGGMLSIPIAVTFQFIAQKRDRTAGLRQVARSVSEG